MKTLQETLAAIMTIFLAGCGGTLVYEEIDGDGSADAPADVSPEHGPDPVLDPVHDPAPDPAADTVWDPAADIVFDPAPDPVADTPYPTGCSDGSEEDVFVPGSMVGCAGRVGWPSRDSLCATGWSACTAEQWVARRAGGTPGHNYWTDDDLRWTGTGPGNCAALFAGGNWCGPDVPMRVCADHEDPEGNLCNWIHCGLASTAPDEWFGGCQENPTAGTLCCR